MPLSPSDLATIANTEEPTVQNDKMMEKVLLSTNVLPALQYVGQNAGVSTYAGTIDNKALLTVIHDIAISQ